MNAAVSTRIVINVLTHEDIYERWVKHPTGREPPDDMGADDRLNRYQHFHGAILDRLMALKLLTLLRGFLENATRIPQLKRMS